MASDQCVLIEVMRSPQRCAELPPGQLEKVLNQARASNTLAMLAHSLEANEVLPILPEWFSRHLYSAMASAKAIQRSVHWEVYKICRALQDIDTPIVFLKGAAYVLAGSHAGLGRMFHDVDFLVPKQRINEVEKALLNHGWVSGHLSNYDNRYYRQWMHEIPPLKHLQRRSVLDVHHAILPETSKAQPSSDLLIKQARPVTVEFDAQTFYVLSPLDMILHSATHLFHDGELEHGFRDMLDLRALLQQYCQSEKDAEILIARAVELHLEKSLFYALRYCQQLLAMRLPQPLREYAEAKRIKPMSSTWLKIMDWLFLRALRPDHSLCELFGSGLARWMVYARSHYLRMPLHLLIPHLVRKSFNSKH